MKNGFKAMDSDMHVMEPCALWKRYIDAKFAEGWKLAGVTPAEGRVQA